MASSVQINGTDFKLILLDIIRSTSQAAAISLYTVKQV